MTNMAIKKQESGKGTMADIPLITSLHIDYALASKR